VYPNLGHRPLIAVRPSHVQALIRGLSVELAPGTVETIYRQVAAVFKAAVRDRVIGRTPCEGITLPKAVKDHKVVPPEIDQVRAVADEMHDRWQAAVCVAAGLGLRQGEVLGLTLDRVDFLRRQVKVDRQMMTLTKQEPRFAPPKTKASYRTVPLPDSVAIVLSEHVRQFPPSEDGPEPPRPRCRRRDARHLRPPLARQRRPHAVGCRRRVQRARPDFRY